MFWGSGESQPEERAFRLPGESPPLLLRERIPFWTSLVNFCRSEIANFSAVGNGLGSVCERGFHRRVMVMSRAPSLIRAFLQRTELREERICER